MRPSERGRRRCDQAHRFVEPSRGVYQAGGELGASGRVYRVPAHQMECDSKRLGVSSRAGGGVARGDGLERRHERRQPIPGRGLRGVRPAGRDTRRTLLHGG